MSMQILTAQSLVTASPAYRPRLSLKTPISLNITPHEYATRASASQPGDGLLWCLSDEGYRRFSKNFKQEGARSDFNYVYQIQRPIHLFDGSERDCYRLLKAKQQALDFVDPMDVVSNLKRAANFPRISGDPGRRFAPDRHHLTDAVKFSADIVKDAKTLAKRYADMEKGGFRWSTMWSDALLSFEVSIATFRSVFGGFQPRQGSSLVFVSEFVHNSELIDGSVLRTQQSLTNHDPNFRLPGFVDAELVRYTEDPNKRLKSDVVEWLEQNAPKSYESVTVYRSFAVQPKILEYVEVKKAPKWLAVLPELDATLKRYAGTTMAALKRGAPAVVKRGKESSWSRSAAMSRNFASGRASGSVNVLVKAEVPADRVIIDFSELPYNVRKEFKYHGQAEVIVGTGAIDGVVADVWIDDVVAESLRKAGLRFDRYLGLVPL